VVAVTYFDRCNEQNSTDIGKKGGQTLSSRDSHGSRESRENIALLETDELLQDNEHVFRRRKERSSMFLVLFIVLLVAWLLGFLAFHIAGGLIHLLLIVAVVCLIVHFVRGRSAA
jgi:hypothetical protein